MKSPFFGLAAGLTAASIWGGMYVVSKVVLEVIPPFSLVTLRLLLGILALYGVVALRKRPRPSQRQILGIFGVGFIGYGVSISLQFVGTRLSTASNGALLTSATPAFVLLFAAFLLGEKITRRKLLALSIATLGVLIVIDPRQAQLSPGLFWGNVCLVMAGITWALYSVLVRKVTRTTDVLTISLIAFAGGLPISAPMGAWEMATQGHGAITVGIIGGVLFLGIIATALAVYLWNSAFAILDAGIAS
ncbi:MAG: DMT family transporter, partial [Anaerolineales bacterium]